MCLSNRKHLNKIFDGNKIVDGNKLYAPKIGIRPILLSL